MIKSLIILTENIKNIRLYYGISKKKMAQLLGIGVKSLRRIKMGDIPPRLSVEILFKIKKHFGIPLTEQFTLLEDFTKE